MARAVSPPPSCISTDASDDAFFSRVCQSPVGCRFALPAQKGVRGSLGDTPAGCSTVAPSLAATPLSEWNASPFTTPNPKGARWSAPGAPPLSFEGFRSTFLETVASNHGSVPMTPPPVPHFAQIPATAAADEPATPRRAQPPTQVRDEQSAPSTPPLRRGTRSLSPPPAPRKIRPEPLLEALMRDSASGVQAACAREPEAARTPFWDHDVEPPLCAAARLGCSPDVIAALLENGADASQRDARGKGPLDLLRPRLDRPFADTLSAEDSLRSACAGRAEPRGAPAPSPLPAFGGLQDLALGGLLGVDMALPPPPPVDAMLLENGQPLFPVIGMRGA